MLVILHGLERGFGAFLRTRWLGAAVVVLVALAAFDIGREALPPTDRDEARFAQATKQMLQTGDYVTIRFQDDFRLKKPAGVYWLQAAAVRLTGAAWTDIAAYRLPSLVAAALGCLVTGWAARPLAGRAGANLAMVMMASLLLLHVEARIAKTDAVLMLCAVVALGALARLWRAHQSGEGGGGPGVAALFWAAMAAGALVKGPLLLLPALGAAVWVSLQGRDAGWLRGLRAQWGAPLALALIAPWFVAITLQTDGAFWTESLGKDLLAKIAAGQESHGAPPGMHLLAFPGVFWPWAGLAVVAAPWVWRHRATPEVGLLLGWTLPFWAALELTPTKLPHYPLPVFPALAILTAMALTRAPTLATGRLWADRLALGVWLVPALALPLAAVALPLALEGAAPLAAVALAALALGAGAVALAAWRRGMAFAAAPAMALGALLTYAAVFGHALPSMRAIWIAPRLQAELAARPALTGPTLLAGYGEPSAIFLLGGDTVLTSAADLRATVAQGAASHGFIAVETEGRDGAITGFNYNGGDWLRFELVTAD